VTTKAKRYTDSTRMFDRAQLYSPVDAIRILKQMPETKFDESVELAIRLGVDPRKADQMVRGTVSLPHGTGKDDLLQEVLQGRIDFDAAVATPDMMPVVGKAGRVLGPRGLMPNPKAGTVTDDIAKAVREIKAGKLEYRVDRQANLHLIIGKRSFDEERLIQNYLAIVDEILRAKPAAAKGRYIRSVTVSTTMGPGIRIDPARIRDVEAAA
jgi:large subunit ribosomal protein L1